MPLHIVCVVLYPGCQSLDVTGPVEVFALANRYLERRGRSRRYEIVLAGKRRGPVVTDSGIRVHSERALKALDGVETLLIPGGHGHARQETDDELLRAVRRLAGGARRIVSVCTGAFVLAAAGLLKGRRATTHWAWADRLAREHPTVSVDPEPIFVRDGKVYTSAGVTAGIDLALALVESDLGREVALAVARGLVVFLRRPANQSQFSVQLRGQIAAREALRRVQGHIGDHLQDDLSVERLADMAAMSPRHFARRFRAEVGLTPARYIAHLRLEAARRLLEESRQPVEVVARECGFASPAALRRLLLRELKTAPREYRRRFQVVPDKTPRSVH